MRERTARHVCVRGRPETSYRAAAIARGRHSLLLVSAGLFVGFVQFATAADPLPATVEFNRDIRPILSDTCFQCHGPDEAQRKAGLRLDLQEAALADLGGYRAIVPGDVEASELLHRVTSDDPGERMPPPAAGRQLSGREVALLRRWIEQGAKWQEHWSFIPPVRPRIPEVANSGQVRNPIDNFVLARLERDGMRLSPEATKTTLIRRVTLDLTGLPPTPAEVDAFLADESPDAYEKLVDRLLDSPRYGERMAIPWLDAARYADTNGYQSDGERHMWRWRDWVIEAYNSNMPFDRFTIEQLAGDLLPNPTLEQRIATGFNRNHRGNAEGGIIPEEYAVEYVVDRVDTTATVWLGLTMGCARCHDHKFDPITQREFYQTYAFFNNIPERGKAIKFGNSPPLIKAPTDEQQAQLARLDGELAAVEQQFAELDPAIEEAQSAWERQLAEAGEPVDWTITGGLLAHFAFEGNTNNGRTTDATPRFVAGEGSYAAGPLAQAAVFDGKRYIDAGDIGDFGFYDKFSCAAWIKPAAVNSGTILSRMADTARADGYSLTLENGRLQVNLVKRWLDDAIRVGTRRTLPPDEWLHVLVTYDGSRVAEGIKVYLNGQPEPLEVHLDDLNQSFQTEQPLRIGAGGGPDSRFRGEMDDVRIYARALSPLEAGLLATTESLTKLAALPSTDRTPAHAKKLRAAFLETAAPPSIRSVYEHREELRRQRAELIETFPTTMVMEELPTPRETYVLLRGEYDKPGERVHADVPASLLPLPEGAPRNRLGFARWLVDPGHPLTARVAVNRYWQMYFGRGLVGTAEDFGSQGEWPTHPELLDWLATEFIRTGWNIKQMQKLIVMSATYRQSSRVTPELLQKDPENRLLARGPRVRLPAELIRDQALFVSGLLVEKVGGPSVKPYQPAELWKDLAGATYQHDTGENLYRRSMYTFWKRTIAPPSMMTFDASGRETCSVRETRTNTPLQALTLMNDVTYVEAARVFAARILREGGDTPQSRITHAFRLATARPPSATELRILETGLQAHLERYRTNPAAAQKLIRTGESPRDEALAPAELAAYTAIAGLILNLDEVITKE